MAPSRHEFGFFTQPSKLPSLLLSLIYNLYTFTNIQGTECLSDNDPLYPILIRTLVSWYNREAFVFKLRGYLLPILPVRVPDCNTLDFLISLYLYLSQYVDPLCG